jgi:hypothetical protein
MIIGAEPEACLNRVNDVTEADVLAGQSPDQTIKLVPAHTLEVKHAVKAINWSFGLTVCYKEKTPLQYVEQVTDSADISLTCRTRILNEAHDRRILYVERTAAMQG